MPTWLSPADQQVLQVARLIMNDKLSFIQATTRVGVQWSEGTFGRNVNRLLTNPTLRKALGSASRRVLAQAVRTVGGEALAMVSTETLAASTALIASISTAALITGALILVGVGLLGGYIWSRGEKPVQAGPAMNHYLVGVKSVWIPTKDGRYAESYEYRPANEWVVTTPVPTNGNNWQLEWDGRKVWCRVDSWYGPFTKKSDLCQKMRELKAGLEAIYCRDR